MSAPIIKIKVTPKSTVKGKMDVRFPANIQTENFLTVERANGTYTFGIDYTVLTPGPISDPTTAIIAILDQTAGVYKEVALSSLLTSGLDADLQAIAALTGTGILSRTADGTWALRTLTAPAAGITITNPAGIAGNETFALANDLAAVEGLASNGIATRTAADTWTVRTITAGASIGVTNGDGVAGNPTIAVTDAELAAIAGLTSAADKIPYFTGSGTASLADFSAFARTLVDDTTQGAMQTTLGLVPGTNVQAFDSDLSALAANASTGLWSITGAGTGSVRTLTGPAAGITVTNGGGVAGNPTLALANDLAAVEGLASTGIARRTGTDAWSVGTAVANSELATMAANTVKANATGGSATPTDVTAATARSSSLFNIDAATSTGDANYTILATDRMVYHTALSAARTDTLPAANAVNPGQQFVINDFRGVATASNTITLQRAGADTINGLSSVVAINAAFGAGIFWSDGVSRWTYQPVGGGGGGGSVTSVVGNGVTITSSGTIPPHYGIVNQSLAVSASAGALTIALKDNAGNDGSASSPINGYFRSATGATGSLTQLSVTSALSLVISSGSTLGVTSSTAFRLWVVLFNDAGTARLGVINCSDASRIYPLNEGAPVSSIAEGGAGAADSAGVIYTGTAVTSKAFLIVGYVEWSATGLTAGTWTTTNLNFIQSFGPGIRKPGDEVQKIYQTTTTVTSAVNTGTTKQLTANTQPITLTSAANLVEVFANGVLSDSSTTIGALSGISPDGGATIVGNTVDNFSAGGLFFVMSPMFALHKPNTSGSTTYSVYIWLSAAGTATAKWLDNAGSSQTGILVVKEIMG